MTAATCVSGTTCLASMLIHSASSSERLWWVHCIRCGTEQVLYSLHDILNDKQLKASLQTLNKMFSRTVNEAYRPFLERFSIGHFHDGVILLQLPEFISFSFSNSNFVVPVESKEQ